MNSIYKKKKGKTNNHSDSFSGIATHYIPSVRIPALEEKLVDLESSEHEIIQRVLEKFVEHKQVQNVGIQKDARQTIDR